jgi:uncharacterized protein (TIRG00374 family)
MQHNQDNPDNPARFATRPRLGRTRVVGLDPTKYTTGPLPTTDNLSLDKGNENTDQTAKKAVVAGKKSLYPQPSPNSVYDNEDASLAEKSTAHLMQLSGMMRPIRKPGTTRNLNLEETSEDGYWPLGIQQAGPLAIVNLYGTKPFASTLPTSVPLVMPGNTAEANGDRPRWKTIPGTSTFKIVLGTLVGLALLYLVSRFIDLPQTFQILAVHLATPQGIGLALLAGIAYLAAHVLRGVRWKLFLNPTGKVSTRKIIGLYQVAAFLNFLLPIRAGEAAKSLALKRMANIPISKSLPTVAMDKVLDLISALVLVILIPVLGISMSLQLWIISALAGVLLLAVLVLIGLAIWKRSTAVSLLQKLFGLFPRAISTKIEGFLIGCVDALLAGASNLSIFLPAVALTCLAVICDGLFTLLAFKTIGISIPFGTALLGYIAYNVCSFLPTPPGQIGINEALGLLVFSALLHMPGNQVIALYIFAHLWTALLLTAVGLSCLKALDLTISSAIHGSETTTKEATVPAPSAVS